MPALQETSQLSPSLLNLNFSANVGVEGRVYWAESIHSQFSSNPALQPFNGRLIRGAGLIFFFSEVEQRLGDKNRKFTLE